MTKRKLRYLIAEKPKHMKQIKNPRALEPARCLEYAKDSVRMEPPFGVIKRQFGSAKIRYRGLAKNTVQVLT